MKTKSQIARHGDKIESQVTTPLPATLSAVLLTPESVSIANELLANSESGWVLVPRIPVSNFYMCGVRGCGDGKCIHQLTDEHCPCCNSNMVLVTTTGHRFCCNHEYYCDYEVSNDQASD